MLRFLGAAWISSIGSWFQPVAIAFLLARLAGPLSWALAIGLTTLPGVFLGPIAGVFADRFERRDYLVALDLLSAVFALLALLPVYLGHAWLGAACLSILALTAANRLYRPAHVALIPALFPDGGLDATPQEEYTPAQRRLLRNANVAYGFVFYAGGMLVGGGLAALVVGTVGPTWGFALNAASFVVSAALLLTVPRRWPTDAPGSVVRVLATFVRVIPAYPSFIPFYILSFAGTVPIYFLLGTAVTYTRALGQPPSFLGAIYAATGAGSLIGLALLLAKGEALEERPVLVALASSLSMPLFAALVFLINPLLALLAIGLADLVGTLGEVFVDNAVLRLVRVAYQGRVQGLNTWFVYLGQLAGAICAKLATHAGFTPMLYIGLSAWVVSLGVIGFYAWRVTRLPAPPGRPAVVSTS